VNWQNSSTTINKLDYYTGISNSSSTTVAATLAQFTTNAGTNGYGLPLQPYNLYEAFNITPGALPLTANLLEFEVTDHLGNVRAVVSGAMPTLVNGQRIATILSLTDYYPFGSKMPGRRFCSSTDYRYGFEGQEYDQETGDNDFGARIYDPRISRWFMREPLALYMPSYSTYSFAYDNPISFVDPDGQLPWPILLKYVGKSRFNGRTSNARISPNFNEERTNPQGETYNHEGTDINWGGGVDDKGIPVVSTAGGEVTFHDDYIKGTKVYKSSGAGHYAEVVHNSRYKTRYLHLENDNTITDGAVNEGDIIGSISNTGTKQVHLHYELLEKQGGKWVPISPYDANGNLIDVQKLVNADKTPKNWSNEVDLKKTIEEFNLNGLYGADIVLTKLKSQLAKVTSEAKQLKQVGRAVPSEITIELKATVEVSEVEVVKVLEVVK